MNRPPPSSTDAAAGDGSGRQHGSSLRSSGSSSGMDTRQQHRRPQLRGHRPTAGHHSDSAAVTSRRTLFRRASLEEQPPGGPRRTSRFDRVGAHNVHSSLNLGSPAAIAAAASSGGGIVIAGQRLGSPLHRGSGANNKVAPSVALVRHNGVQFNHGGESDLMSEAGSRGRDSAFLSESDDLVSHHLTYNSGSSSSGKGSAKSKSSSRSSSSIKSKGETSVISDMGSTGAEDQAGSRRTSDAEEVVDVRPMSARLAYSRSRRTTLEMAWRGSHNTGATNRSGDDSSLVSIGSSSLEDVAAHNNRRRGQMRTSLKMSQMSARYLLHNGMMNEPSSRNLFNVANLGDSGLMSDATPEHPKASSSGGGPRNRKELSRQRSYAPDSAVGNEGPQRYSVPPHWNAANDSAMGVDVGLEGDGSNRSGERYLGDASADLSLSDGSDATPFEEYESDSSGSYEGSGCRAKKVPRKGGTSRRCWTVCATAVATMVVLAALGGSVVLYLVPKSERTAMLRALLERNPLGRFMGRPESAPAKVNAARRLRKGQRGRRRASLEEEFAFQQEQLYQEQQLDQERMLHMEQQQRMYQEWQLYQEQQQQQLQQQQQPPNVYYPEQIPEY